jgi:hypothetical protein
VRNVIKGSGRKAEGAVSGSQQQVKVVGQQNPCVTGSKAFSRDRLHPMDEIVADGTDHRFILTL